MMGLAAARELLDQGVHVELLEAGPELGGLAAPMDYGPFVWDRFYHCILPGDANVLGLIDRLGLTSEVRWSRTSSGFYFGGETYSLKTAAELLAFKPLPFLQRVRLGLFGVLCGRMFSGDDLEHQTAEAFLRRYAGDAAWDVVWHPLLRAKLGEAANTISARFIWDSVNRLQSSRQGVKKEEKLGFVSGGYARVRDALVKQLKADGAVLKTGVAVQSIARASDGSGAGVAVETDAGRFEFDDVLITVSSPVASRLVSGAASELLASTAYMGVVVGALVLKRALNPYYILNISDPGIDLTGIIGTSNLVGERAMNGYHLYYTPRYLMQEDPAWGRSDSEWAAHFRSQVSRVIPDLQDDDIESSHVSRARFVQPILDMGYRDRMPPLALDPPGIWLVNSSHCYQGPVNLDLVVGHAVSSVREIIGSR